MKLIEAKKLTKKANKNVYTSMSVYHSHKIQEAAQRGYNYIKLNDYNESIMLMFREYGYTTEVYVTPNKFFKKQYLIVSW